MNDSQVIASFCISLIGAALMLVAYLEVNEMELDFDESEDDEK